MALTKTVTTALALLFTSHFKNSVVLALWVYYPSGKVQGQSSELKI